MGQLEDMGYLIQPHTSAGRVPTDQGYRYYVDGLLSRMGGRKPVFPRMEVQLQELYESLSGSETFVEEASRVLADMTREVGLVLWPEKSLLIRQDSRAMRVFLQGSMHLLEKPEFQDVAKIRELFRVFEEKRGLTEWVAAPVLQEGVYVRIGKENEPEALQECAVVSTRYRGAHHPPMIFALVGPRRMQYAHTIPLLTYVACTVGRLLDQRGA